MDTSVMSLELTIRDVRETDLPGLERFGSPAHMRQVAKQLERVRAGVAEYLLVVLPSGRSVGTAGIDYEKIADAGYLFQYSVLEELQSCGIGTALIRESERRILARGLAVAEIGVEENNPRARALYERLGYVAYGTEPDAWDQDQPDGTTIRYETVLTKLSKKLR